MTHERLRTALLEQIGSDRSTQTAIRARMEKTRHQRTTARRRRIAVAGTTLGVAAAIGSVFVIGGTVPGGAPSIPHLSAAAPSPVTSDTARTTTAHEQVAATEARERASRQAQADAIAREVRAKTQACREFGRVNPVASGGVVDDAAVVRWGSACATIYQALTAPRIEWVETDADGIESYLGANTLADSAPGDRYLLVLVTAAMAPPEGGSESERVVLTVPLSHPEEPGALLNAGIVPGASLERLGTVHRN